MNNEQQKHLDFQSHAYPAADYPELATLRITLEQCDAEYQERLSRHHVSSPEDMPQYSHSGPVYASLKGLQIEVGRAQQQLDQAECEAAVARYNEVWGTGEYLACDRLGRVRTGRPAHETLYDQVNQNCLREEAPHPRSAMLIHRSWIGHVQVDGSVLSLVGHQNGPVSLALQGDDDSHHILTVSNGLCYPRRLSWAEPVPQVVE